jgi:hypothetical protein
MATRVALVACSETTEGPWTLAKGNESGIKIVHLCEGERVRLEVDVAGTSSTKTFDQSGSYPLQIDIFNKYRVIKEVDPEVRGSPTTVEIILNGKAHN